jgi:hypothetical protein
MDTAQQIVALVARGDFAAVEQRLAAPLKSLLSAETLQATWQGLEQQVGAFQRQGDATTVQTPQGLVHVVTCVFARGNLSSPDSF